MNFGTIASNIILVVFQITLFFNTYVYLNEKPYPDIFYEIK